jgi:hypothetical protein
MAERRAFQRKVAAAGTGAIALPVIVTGDPADAPSLTSPPPESPQRTSPPVIDLADITHMGTMDTEPRT